MTRPSSGGSAAKYPFDLPPEVEAVWQELESGLATYVAGLPAAAATHQGEGVTPTVWSSRSCATSRVAPTPSSR